MTVHNYQLQLLAELAMICAARKARRTKHWARYRVVKWKELIQAPVVLEKKIVPFIFSIDDVR